MERDVTFFDDINKERPAFRVTYGTFRASEVVVFGSNYVINLTRAEAVVLRDFLTEKLSDGETEG